MTDIVLLNLENRDRAFVECVNNEQRNLKSAISTLNEVDQPTFKRFNCSDDKSIYNAAVSASRILHIAGHGTPHGEISNNSARSRNRNVPIRRMTDYLVMNNFYLDVDCIVLDACYSARGAWRSELEGIVGPKKEIIVVGSAYKLPFPQAEEYFKDFYDFLLQKKLPSRSGDLRNRAEQAHKFARKNFRYRHWYPSMLLCHRLNESK